MEISTDLAVPYFFEIEIESCYCTSGKLCNKQIDFALKDILKKQSLSKMNYTSLKEAKKKKRHRSTSLGKTTARKLFSFLLCHGEECRLGLPDATKRLCKFTGRDVGNDETMKFLSSFDEFFVVKKVDGINFVEAKTSVKLCDAYQDGKCRNPSCKQLHICRFHLQGSCKYGEDCKKHHGYGSVETKRLLQENKLNDMPSDALNCLFKKVLSEKKIKHASATSGPEPCKFYNKGGCKNGDKCEFMHVCQHFVNGDCTFGEARCKRFHHFDTLHSRKVLADHGLGGLRNKSQILSVLRNNGTAGDSSSESDYDDFLGFLHNLSSGCKIRSGQVSPSSTQPQSMLEDVSKDDEKIEICGFNLRGRCSYGVRCHARHTSLPYEWQYVIGQDSSSWMSFGPSENKRIEKAFCVCKESSVTAKMKSGQSCAINFQSMTGSQYKGFTLRIRRLSTVSSVLAASGHVFRTNWKWYWKDEHEKWQSYDHGKADTNSERIEQDYQSESGERKHMFTAGSQKYTLHFGDPNQMHQQNEKHGTKRDVRRRPAQFLDEDGMKQVMEEFKRNRQRTTSASNETVSSVPSHWGPVDSTEEFTEVDLSEVIHHDEYTRVKKQFLSTMSEPSFTVKSIKRVQNPGLWEDYQRQMAKITKKNAGKAVEEKWLFHGTNKDTVHPISQQGFDWRLSGKHGTRYGKGSYFATEASYSHSYCNRDGGNDYRMFLAKVIVGSYVVGSHDTQRPPPKDRSNPLSALYDSCVNDVTNPRIFVIFERSQAYPYYIINYGKEQCSYL